VSDNGGVGSPSNSSTDFAPSPAEATIVAGFARMAVVIPFKEGSREQVRDLAAKGPPFDLGDSGLEAHHVFLTERSAIFVFEAGDAAAVERLIADAGAWAAAEAWREHLAGEPEVAEDAYSWTRSDVPDGVSFAPTPGPGDSEGGDLYPP
jgi:hypothetical protein